jgi:uncharacterized membrane protein YeaQ/YmgE (transglycosylase-associated protein family)
VGIIAWIVLGLVAGFIAEKLLGGREKHGLIITILLGIAGALLAGWAASKLFNIDTNQGFFNTTTWLSAIVGSVVLLLIYHAINSNSSRSRRPLRRRVRR